MTHIFSQYPNQRRSFLFQFITADVYGVFCWGFCDFGDSFEVLDTTGEEPKEVFVSKITKVTRLSFLALLDYVSRAHEIEIRPSSVCPSVRPSSVCGIDYL